MPKSPEGGYFTPPPPLDQRDWQFLFINSRTINYEPMEVVLAEGDKNTDLWYIQSGSVQVITDSEPGTILGVGEFFGDISFISQVPTACKILSHTKCILQRISANSVLRMLECGM